MGYRLWQLPRPAGAAFPSGRAHHEQVDGLWKKFMRTIEDALIDEVGFDDYCKAFRPAH